MTAQKLQFQIKSLTGATTMGVIFQRRSAVVCQLEEIAKIDFNESKKRILVSDENALKIRVSAVRFCPKPP